jgi:hypothetical protein
MVTGFTVLANLTQTRKITTLNGLHGIRVEHAQDHTDHRGEHLGWVDPHDVDSHDGYGGRPWVSLIRIARSECQAGQSTTVDRSNFRSLMRDYPDVWTNISYSNVEALGAYVDNLSDELIDVIAGLSDGYPVYDEEDLGELEDSEISSAWDNHLSWDARRDLPEDLQDAWDTLNTSGVNNDTIGQAFYQAMSDIGYYPEHSGYEVLWDDAKVTEVITLALGKLSAA